MPPDSYFRRVKQILDHHGILFICDEVQSGFGRCGSFFAIEQFGVEPDILVAAKGIADGFPIAACISTPEIGDSLKPGEHLSTYGGNPICCAAASANIDVMLEEDLSGQSARKGERFLGGLHDLAGKHELIGEVRGIGLMMGMELVTDRKSKAPAKAQAAEIRKICRENGVLVGVGGQLANVIRIQPPLIISDAQLDRTLDVLDRALVQTAKI